jgi:hypothetical protein
MRFDSVRKLKDEAFRRITGVQRGTFDAMAALLFAAKCLMPRLKQSLHYGKDDCG